MSCFRPLIIIIVIVILFLSFIPLGIGQDRMPIVDIDIVKYINENQPRAEDNIRLDIERGLIEPLIDLAATKDGRDTNSPKEIAINLLGHFRVADAASILVEDIDYCPPIFGSIGPSISFFPCAEALIKIGLPAIEAIFSKCRKRIDDRHLILYAWVISYVHGYEMDEMDEVGKYRIELELSRTTIPEKRRNLQKLLKVYEAKDEFFTYPPSSEREEEEPGEDNSKQQPKDELLKQPPGKSSEKATEKETLSEQQTKAVVKELPIQSDLVAEGNTELGPKQRDLAIERGQDQLVPILFAVITVLAGLVLFLLLRRKK